jgi:hypothetical protein
VKTLPWILEKSFGSTDHYSLAQVRRELKDEKIHPHLIPYAFAAYCIASDAKSELHISDEGVAALRGELIDLFGIPNEDFTVEDLRRMRIRENWTPGHWWHSDWTLYRGDGGGGHQN